MRKIGFRVVAVLAIALAVGCKREPRENRGTTPPSTPAKSDSTAGPEIAARVHWLGKKRITSDTNSAFVMTIWDLPESIKLEAQTLDKLALAPSRWLQQTNQAANANHATSNATSVVFRPLAEDLLQAESYWEVTRSPGQPPELAFAVRLSDERAGLWDTNLATALESLTGQRPVAAAKGRGWALKLSAPSIVIEVARVEGWVTAAVRAGSEPSTLLPGLVGRIGRNPAPVAPGPTNFWLEVDVNLARFAAGFPVDWVPTNGLPRLTFNVLGDNQTVRVLGQATFARPLGFEVERWNMPTNLIHDPLTSFTAIQGAGAWLGTLPVWNRCLPGFAPNQVFIWGQGRLPLQTYLAVPTPDAAARVNQIGERMLEANPWIATNSLGQIQNQTNSSSVLWANIPFADPHIEAVKDGQTDLIFGGLGAPETTNRPMPFALWPQVVGNPKLIVYDWEFTGQRVEGGLYLSQLIRFLGHKAQLPPESVGVAWLKALENRLGNCGTIVTRNGPSELSIVRRSSLGLTAFELNLLADWLESPRFPHGLHSFDVPPPRSSRQRTNSTEQPKGN